MKQWRDNASPYGIRLYFEGYEFETMMDDARLIVEPDDGFVPGKGVDVDLVLLRAFGLEADYVELTPGVLGRTLFGPSGPLEIHVSRALVEEAEFSDVARRLLRTTLAHETGHVACHPILFFKDITTAPLFPTEYDDPQQEVLCRDNTVERLGYTGNWVEYQANQCMASLLMPSKLFAAYVDECLGDLSQPSVEAAILNDRGRDVWRWLSDVFDVNERAIHYRLKELGFVPDGVQQSLSLDS